MRILAGLATAATATVLAGCGDSTSSTSTTETAQPAGAAKTTETVRDAGGPPPRVDILSARLGRASPQTGRARLVVRARVTNRGDGPLEPESPVLVSGDDEVALDDAGAGIGQLLDTLASGETAVGALRFQLPADVTRRVTRDRRARLRIAGRNVALKPRPPKATGLSRAAS